MFGNSKEQKAMRVRSLFIIFCIALASTILIGNAQATPITFAYEGEINFTEGGPVFDAFMGETFRVEYTFEDTATDTNPNPLLGDYLLSSLTFMFGSNVYQAILPAQIEVNLMSAAGIYDVETLNGLTGPSIGGLVPHAGILRLRNDSNPIPFTDTSLPTTQPNPTDFGSRSFMNVVFAVNTTTNNTPIGQVSVKGNTSIRCLPPCQSVPPPTNPIPEPSTMLLFGTGLAGLAVWRYRKSVKA